MWLYFRFSSERVKLNCVTNSVKFEYLYLRKLSMIRNKVVWDKHYIIIILTYLLCGISFYYVTVDFALYVSLKAKADDWHIVLLGKFHYISRPLLFVKWYLIAYALLGSTIPSLSQSKEYTSGISSPGPVWCKVIWGQSESVFGSHVSYGIIEPEVVYLEEKRKSLKPWILMKCLPERISKSCDNVCSWLDMIIFFPKRFDHINRSDCRFRL